MKLASIKTKIAYIFNKYFIIIVALVVLIILGGAYMLFVKDTLTEINNTGITSLRTEEGVLQQKQLTLDKLNKLKEKYSGIQKEKLDQLSYFLPSESEIPFLMIEIKDFITENKLVLNSIESGPLGNTLGDTAAKGSAVSSLNITLGIKGIDSYFKLKDFLDNMSQRLPLLELNSLSYSPETDVYALNLTTYYK
ncbi:MAG: type 4a pilus biogenesis protein PilO [Patescibacteria group bacterium]|jgi:Tfp pilus assembly protein PilO